MQENHPYKKSASIVIWILALILLFMLLESLIIAFLLSLIVSYLAYPLFAKIHTKVKNKMLAIIVTLLLITLVILLPFIYLGYQVTHEGILFYKSISGTDGLNNGLYSIQCDASQSIICSGILGLESLSKRLGLDQQLPKLASGLEKIITDVISQVPTLVITMILTIFISYYFLKDGKTIISEVSSVVPLKRKTINELITQFKNITHFVVFGQLLVALVQGLLGALGFFLAGIPFPLLFGFLIGMASFIPSVGTALIWVPAAITLIITGLLSGDNFTMWKGIGLFLYGLLILSLIDNFLIIRIVRTTAKIHPLLVLIGIIGGVSVFGFVGIFVGPIIVPLLIKYFQIFNREEP